MSVTNDSQFAQPKKHHGQQCVRNNMAPACPRLPGPLREGVCLRECVNARLDEGLDGGGGGAGNICCQLTICLLPAKLWTVCQLSVKWLLIINLRS